MRRLLVISFLSVVMFACFSALADNKPVVVSASQVVVVSSPTPSVEPESTPLPPVVPPDEISDQVIKLLNFVYTVPVVGPVVAKGVQILALIGTLATLLFGFLLGGLRASIAVLNYTSLVSWVTKLEAFQNSKIFYWIKWASNFSKPEVKSGKVEAPSNS